MLQNLRCLKPKFINVTPLFKAVCNQHATRFDLPKTFGAKFIKFIVITYFGKGSGFQYIGIDMEKGIDNGIRGNFYY